VHAGLMPDSRPSQRGSWYAWLHGDGAGHLSIISSGDMGSSSEPPRSLTSVRERSRTRGVVVVAALCWSVAGMAFCVHYFVGWIALGSGVGFVAGLLLALAGTVGCPVALLFICVGGISICRAAQGRYVMIIWIFLTSMGIALQVALWRGLMPWPTGTPRPLWQTALWAGFAVVGLAMVAVLTEPWRLRISAENLELTWREAKGISLAFMGASLLLVTCLAGFAAVEQRNLSSVHQIHAGRESVLRLRPGVYNFDQDPGTGSERNTEAFSVIGPDGPVAVSPLSGEMRIGDLGGVFLKTGRYAPAANFIITKPGAYRVSLKPVVPDLAEVLVSDSYGAILARTAPWAVGILGALVAMALCLIRMRGVYRRVSAKTADA
jgi:hypothetical protein